MANMHRFLMAPGNTLVYSIKSLCLTRLKESFSLTLSPKNLQMVRCMSSSNMIYPKQNSSGNQPVLTRSTFLRQNDNNIEEVPVLVRLVKKETFPLNSEALSGQSIRMETEFETNLKKHLQNCTSVTEVFKHLEVPHDSVKGYSAAFALQRLHVLKHMNSDWVHIHSFIRSAVMKELYDTVQTDIHSLSNQTLISLVESYLSTSGFSLSCVDAINAELQGRLADSALSLEEVLTLANMLHEVMKVMNSTNNNSAIVNLPSPTLSSGMKMVSEAKSRFLSDVLNEKLDKAQHFDKFCAQSQENWELTKAQSEQLMDNVWVHLGSRYADQTATTIPLTMQSLPKHRKSQVHLLEQPLGQVYLGLSPHGAASCLDSLVRLKIYSPNFLSHLCHWAYLNVHLVTPHLLLTYLNSLMHFRHFDQHFVRVIERCVWKGGDETDADILALCVEYLRSHRYLSPFVMNTAAAHFTKHAEDYDNLPLFVVLRAFGFLNFTPKEKGFVKKVSTTLQSRLLHMNPHHLLEVLGSFTMLGLTPRSFQQSLQVDTRFTRLRSSKNPSPEEFHSSMWLQLIRHTLEDSSIHDKFDQVTTGKLGHRWVYFFVKDLKFVRGKLEEQLDNFLGRDYYHSLQMYGCHVFYLDKEGNPLRVKKDDLIEVPEHHSRHALVLRTADHLTANTQQLLGAPAKLMNDVQGLGFTVTEIQVVDIRKVGSHRRERAVRNALERYVNLPKV